MIIWIGIGGCGVGLDSSLRLLRMMANNDWMEFMCKWINNFSRDFDVSTKWLLKLPCGSNFG
jgi:hypothetical protein